MSMKIAVNHLPFKLLPLLVAVFLVMQWSTVHVHLAEQHNHNGSHYHQAEIHSHDIDSQFLENGHQLHGANHTDVIEVDDDYSLQRIGDKLSATILLSSANTGLLYPVFFIVTLRKAVVKHHISDYFSFSSLHSRAPPLFL
ncbi:MAG: hypothetical protein ACWA5R_07355 [bacterium]